MPDSGACSKKTGNRILVVTGIAASPIRDNPGLIEHQEKSSRLRGDSPQRRRGRREKRRAGLLSASQAHNFCFSGKFFFAIFAPFAALRDSKPALTNGLAGDDPGRKKNIRISSNVFCVRIRLYLMRGFLDLGLLAHEAPVSGLSTWQLYLRRRPLFSSRNAKSHSRPDTQS